MCATCIYLPFSSVVTFCIKLNLGVLAVLVTMERGMTTLENNWVMVDAERGVTINRAISHRE